LLLAARAAVAQPEPPQAQSPAAKPADAKAHGLPARDDVSVRLEEAREPHAGLLKLGPVSVAEDAWTGLNDRLEEAARLRFGLAYTLSFQAATSGPADRSGGEGDFDLFGSWRLIGKEGGPDTGTLNLNAQHIHLLGETAPANLAENIGALWGTSDGIGSSESFPITQLYYEQHLFDDRLLAIVGKIETTNYVNTNRFADDTQYFMNRAFSSNPALNYPGAGLGAVLAWQVTESWYIGGCIADANGDETESGFGTIGDGEFFTAIEAGCTLDLDGLGEGTYRLTLWHSDAAHSADLPEDHGLALSIDQEIGRGIVPFFRATWSDADATGIPALVAGGIGIEGPFGRDEDVFGLGLSWGASSEHEVDDQLAAEAFYRLQLAPNIQWTLGAQVIFNAIDPESGASGETVGIVELRVRITF
jgi:hypothetical protein